MDVSELDRPLQAVIVGAGHRALLYASYALEHPEKLEITGVVDPMEDRREYVAKLYRLDKTRCFAAVEELMTCPKLADVIINGTMDHQHVRTSLPLLEKGYDILLEKPFAVNEEEMEELIGAVEKYQRKIMICHVLRYTPFYREIKQRLVEGAIGDIVSIQTTEHVSFHHMSTSYVRGKWRSEKYSHTPMLLAKCCHDLDIVLWMQSGVAPTAVSSFGSTYQFVPQRKPEGAGTRCMTDCKIEEQCVYSARKHYIENPDRWSFYVWDCFEYGKKPTIQEKIDSLKTDNDYGKCVWHCDNEVVDHQAVLIEFCNGSTAVHTMVGGAAESQRSIHIIGTLGEISGIFENQQFTIKKINPGPGRDFDEEVINLKVTGDMVGAFGGHGGGDLALVEDFVDFIKDKKPSLSCTSLMDSVFSHKIAFCAEKSRKQYEVVQLL